MAAPITSRNRHVINVEDDFDVYLADADSEKDPFGSEIDKENDGQ